MIKATLLPWYFRLGASPALIRMAGCLARFLKIFGMQRIVYKVIMVTAWKLSGEYSQQVIYFGGKVPIFTSHPCL